MKNIYIVPTDKPSVLKQNNITKKISLVNKGIDLTAYTPINIYITSYNADINENDYIITKDGRLVEVSYLLSKDLEGASKIILTTDVDLNKDGVWGIEDGFLEWFVKNPTCEYVELKGYAIILPGESCDCDTKCDACKEEETKQEGCCTPVGQLKRYVDCKGCDKKPKQENTLEDIGRKAVEYCTQYKNSDKFVVAMLAIQFGYQLALQQEDKNSYSEEEVIQTIRDFKYDSIHIGDMNPEKWFKQFKNK